MTQLLLGCELAVLMAVWIGVGIVTIWDYYKIYSRR